jgi:hypothetical protein
MPTRQTARRAACSVGLSAAQHLSIGLTQVDLRAQTPFHQRLSTAVWSALDSHDSACRTNGWKAYSTPIFAALAPEEPQILRRWNSDRGLCDRLDYSWPSDPGTIGHAAAGAVAIGEVEAVNVASARWRGVLFPFLRSGRSADLAARAPGPTPVCRPRSPQGAGWTWRRVRDSDSGHTLKCPPRARCYPAPPVSMYSNTAPSGCRAMSLRRSAQG